MTSFLLGIDPGLKLLGYMVTLCLTEELPNSFPKRLTVFMFSQAMHESSDFSTLSQMLDILYL